MRGRPRIGPKQEVDGMLTFILTVFLISLVFIFLIAGIGVLVELFLLPIRIGWWFITLPFRLLFGGR